MIPGCGLAARAGGARAAPNCSFWRREALAIGARPCGWSACPVSSRGAIGWAGLA